MAPANYYSKKELTKIGLEGFALIDEFYGGGRKGKKQLPNYGGHATYKVTSRPLPPPPPAATPVVAINNYSTASSSGYSRRLHHAYNYRYSPAESHVCWTPVVAMTTETTTVIRSGYEAGKLHAADILMDNYKY